MGAPRPLTPAPAERGPGLLASFGAQRLVLLLAGLVVVAAIGLLAYGFYSDQIAPRRALAVQVGDQRYSMEYFAKRYKKAVETSPDASSRTGLFTDIPNEVRDTIVRESLTLQGAPALGVRVTDSEIDQAMLSQLNVPVATDPETGALQVTPGVQAAVRNQLRLDDLRLADYREIQQANLLESRIQERFRADAPASGPQARIRVLQFPSDSDAREAIRRITAGEATFAELADTVSIDPAGRGRGGERDWLPRGVLPAPVEEQAFTLPLNTLSEPIDAGTENGWIVLEVLERADDRPISDEARRQLGDIATDAWYAEQRERLGVRDGLTESKIQWAFEYAMPEIPGITTDPLGGSGLPGQFPAGGQSIPVTIPGEGQPSQPNNPAAPAPAQPPAGGQP